jgi:hypothetical protein
MRPGKDYQQRRELTLAR